MKPSIGSDADPLRRPLLNTSSGVEEEERLGHLSSSSRTSEKREQICDEANFRSEHETDSILTLEGVSPWAPPQHYPRLERQRAGSAQTLHAVQLTTSTADIEHRGDISAYRRTSAVVGNEQNNPPSTIPNAAATRNPRPRPTCEASPQPNISTTSPTVLFPRNEQHSTARVFETSGVGTLQELPRSQTQFPAPTQTPPVLVRRAGDSLPGHSDPRHSIRRRLCFTCLSRAQRAGWRMLRTCRDCSTAFWWLLSPLFLLFTWFCWHGVHALWKVSSRGPGHWLSAEEEGVVHDYGLVIDAGSHGSRLSIYSWKPRLFDPTHPFTGPVSFPKLCFRGIPQGALTSPLQVPSILGALIDQGTDFLHFRARIPELRWSDFPLYLKATGGMRNMDQAPRDILMETVRDYLESRQFNPFRFERAWARVLAGEEEGVYGWLAVNNGRNSLIDDPALTTGALDLGGASAQITFFPTHTSVLEDLTLVRLGDRTIRLYSHSYLGYGWGDALSRVSVDLAVEALLQRIKANPKFITENIRAARPLAVSSDGRSIWEETIPPHDAFTFFKSGARSSSTSQKANSGIPSVRPSTKDTRGSHALREAREVRRLSAEVDNEEVDVPRATTKSRNGSVSERPLNSFSTELEKRTKAIGTKTGGRRSRHFGGRKRRKKAKETVDVSGQQRRKGNAAEQSDEPKEGSILPVKLQSETSSEEKGNAHIPIFSSSDDELTSRSHDAHRSRHGIQESEPYDSLGFLRPQQNVRKGVGAKEAESGFSHEGSRKQMSSPAAAARLFLLKGEKPKRDKSTHRPSIEGSQPLWKKQELQYGRTGFPWTRRRTAATAANPPEDKEINDVEREKHQPGISQTNEEHAPVKVPPEEEKITQVPHESGKSADTIPEGEEIQVDKQGLSDSVVSAEETTTPEGTEKPLGESAFAYELVFTVEHPCFPRGTVYDFPLPLLSYPERRYYVDISVNKIEAYMRAAGYAKDDIKENLKTMYPHALDNHQATQDSVSDNLHLLHDDGEQAAEDDSNVFPPDVPYAQQTSSHQAHLEEVNSERKHLLQRAGVRIRQHQVSVDALSHKPQHATGREENDQRTNIRQTKTSGSNHSSSFGEESRSSPDFVVRAKNDKEIEIDAEGTLFSFSPLAAVPPAAPGAVPPAAASVQVTHGKNANETKSTALGDTARVAADFHGEDGSSATAAARIPTLPDETTPAVHAMNWKPFREEMLSDEGQEEREKTKKRPKEHFQRDQERTASGEEEFLATVHPKIRFIARFVGSGDFDACQARAKKLFHKSLCFMNSCSFNGVYQPRLENSNFLAFGQYSKVHAAMGLPPNAPLSAFYEGARGICSQRVGQLQLKRRFQGLSALVYSKRSLEKLCWKAIWSYAMLRQGYGFAGSSTRISFAPVPGDSEAGPAPEWATGSMIAEVNSYPWEVPPETYEGPFHLATAFLIMSVILALILYHEVHWMRRRLRESQRREPTENGDVVVVRGPTGDVVATAGKSRGEESVDG